MTISPEISFKGKYTFAPFADVSYERLHTVLPYPVDPPFPSDFVTKDLQIRTGFLLNTSKAYIGLTADVANYTTDYSTFTEKWQVFSKVGSDTGITVGVILVSLCRSDTGITVCVGRQARSGAYGGVHFSALEN